MNYALNNLGNKNFEHLVQSLCKKIIGEGISIFGAGPDGQREATFDGKAPYPSTKECWDGYWVIQAKFKEQMTKTKDWTWLKNNFEKEMRGFKARKTIGKKIPNNYLFFTNVILTPVEDIGIKDRIESLKKQYINLIPNIHIIGYDEICTFLDGHRDIAVAYTSYILSGDVLSLLYSKVERLEKDYQKTFFRYLQRTFNDDYCSRMEQAGQVAEKKVSIEKVFVDLEFEEEDTKINSDFIKYSISIGDCIHRFSNIDKKDTAKKGKNSYSSNKYVLKGSAGQGKSTVCQFLAQIYRATFLQNFETSIKEINEFIETLKEDFDSLPKCCRIPIRMELRMYSSWIIQQQKDRKNFDLVSYITSIIEEKASGEFGKDTLRYYLSKYSWVFFFDGLDEVPDSSNRKDIMDEIYNFINIELRQADADALFFATTRPEGYVGEFNKTEFTHLNLVSLNRNRCYKYLNKLLLAIENDSTKRSTYFDILKRSWNNEQIAFMMRTPLQATIMTILIRAGGEPPRDKFSLFKEYFDIIIKREKQKGVESILNNNQDLVEGVYYMLGYDLQKRSSTSEGSDALIDSKGLKQLITKRLYDDGIDESNSEFSRLLEETFSMIVNRINFASEIKEGYIGFTIRSIQEFLASIYLVAHYKDEELCEVLKDLSRNSYWKNTFVFTVEYISKIKMYFLDNIVDTILSELNGNDQPLNNYNPEASVFYGSQVAFTLLANNIFKNKPRYENKLCKYIVDYLKLQPSTDMYSVLSMSDNVKNELTEILLKTNENDFTSGHYCLIALLIQDSNCYTKLKKITEKNAPKVVEQFYRIFSGTTSSNFHKIVSVAINTGAIINIKEYQVLEILQNAQNFCTLEAKKSLYCILLKSVLNNCTNTNYINELSAVINKSFKFLDISPIVDVSSFEFEEFEVWGDTIVGYYAYPYLNQESIELFIKSAKQYNLEGLVLILNTLPSKNIEDYVTFANKIIDYKSEIDLLNLEELIYKNKLMLHIYRLIKRGTIGLLDVSFWNKIKSEFTPKKADLSFKEYMIEIDKPFSFYNFMYALPDEKNVLFQKFYKNVLKHYNPEEIQKHPYICELLVMMFTIFNLDKLSGNNDNSFVLESEILAYTKFCDKERTWLYYFWAIYFLITNKKSYLQQEIRFCLNLKNRKNHNLCNITENNKSLIINNALDYLLVENNKDCINFILDLLLNGIEYETFINIDWEKAKKINHKIIYALYVLYTCKDQPPIITCFLPLLKDSETGEFFFELLKKMKMQEVFSPVYIFFLKNYNLDYASKRICEQRILELITNRNIEV